MLETPETKVVIFSQWVRTHELVAAPAQAARWGHVLFPGGVPGPKRKDLDRTASRKTRTAGCSSPPTPAAWA